MLVDFLKIFRSVSRFSKILEVLVGFKISKVSNGFKWFQNFFRDIKWFQIFLETSNGFKIFRNVN